MKEILPLVGSHAGTRYFCHALAALVGHYLNSFVPIAQQARQAAVHGRLSLSVCLWFPVRVDLFATVSEHKSFSFVRMYVFLHTRVLFCMQILFGLAVLFLDGAIGHKDWDYEKPFF
jgi:hypothetical protein